LNTWLHFKSREHCGFQSYFIIYIEKEEDACHAQKPDNLPVQSQSDQWSCTIYKHLIKHRTFYESLQLVFS
jgi:hypothetical protein